MIRLHALKLPIHPTFLPFPLNLPSRQPYGLVQLCLQQSLWRQLREILVHPDLAPDKLQ